MKKKLFIVIPLILVIAAYVLLRSTDIIIDSGFATKALLRFHYADQEIDVEITDADDLKALKSILKGITYIDHPSCGFTIYTSITLTNGKKSITFCPACDGCSTIQICESNRYLCITERQRERLDTILKKYGMTFPCV